jgi:hypothetical protein
MWFKKKAPRLNPGVLHIWDMHAGINERELVQLLGAVVHAAGGKVVVTKADVLAVTAREAALLRYTESTTGAVVLEYVENANRV